jgi:heat shock protein HslJ
MGAMRPLLISVLLLVAAGQAPSFDEAANLTFTGLTPAPITLLNGVWEGNPSVPGSAARLRVELLTSVPVTGDLTGDGTPESVMLLAASSGGSGTRLHVAVVGRAEGRVMNLASVEVGDRVQVRRTAVTNRRIEMDVVRAGQGDAMCCPTEKAHLAWALEGTRLVTKDDTVTGRASIDDIAGTEWVLTHFDWTERAPDNPPVTLELRGGSLSGRGGCNRYSGAAKTGEGAGGIAIGPVAATRMACEPEAMRVEDRFFAALNSVTSYSFQAGQLVLSYEQQGARKSLRLSPKA